VLPFQNYLLEIQSLFLPKKCEKTARVDARIIQSLSAASY